MVTYSKSLAGDSVPPRQAERFFESLLTRTRDMSSTRAGLEEEILQLSRQIDLLSSCETKKQGKTNGEVTVVIMAKKATNIELRLTYRMSLSMLSIRSFSLNCLTPCQLSETQRGLLRTSYTRPRKLGFPRHQYPCIIVPGSRKVQAKIGQTSGSHLVPLTWTYRIRLSPSSVLRRSDLQGHSSVSVAGPCRCNNSNSNKSHMGTSISNARPIEVQKSNPLLSVPPLPPQVAYLAQRPGQRCRRRQ